MSVSLPVPKKGSLPVTDSLGFSKLGDYNSSQEIRETHFPSILSRILLSFSKSNMAKVAQPISLPPTLTIGREKTASLIQAAAPHGQASPGGIHSKAPISNIYLESEKALPAPMIVEVTLSFCLFSQKVLKYWAGNKGFHPASLPTFLNVFVL